MADVTNAVDITTGATLVFGTSSLAMKITAIKAPGLTRPKVDTTDLTTSAVRTSIVGDLAEVTNLEFEGFLNSDFTNVATAMAEDSETITLTFLNQEDNAGAVWVITGALQSFEPNSSGIDETMTYSASVVCFALPAITAAGS